MITRKILCLATLGSLLAISSSAQNGYLFSRQGMGITDMAELSSVNHGFGTARSAAMGGAFTSLGADLSSMGINPAGLGLYRSSELSISPAFTLSQYDNDSFDQSVSKRKSKMSLDNIGVAYNVYQGSGGLTSFTFGISYNKLADLTYRSNARTPDDFSSIGYAFANHARSIPHSYMNSTSSRDFEVGDFGDWLAYHTGLINPIDGTTDQYTANNFSGNDPKTHYMSTSSKGYIGEMNIAAGVNISNKFYFGMSVGIRDIYQKQNVNYSEEYLSGLPSSMGNMRYHQYSKVVGDAVNFKFGAIVHPIEGLRIGLAVHTPSFVSYEKTYQASMSSRFNNGNRYDMESNYVYSDYDFRTPTRLLGGISYIFGDKGLVSFDYERMWYDGMRVDVENDPGTIESDFKDMMKSTYKPRNTYRFGGEYRPMPMLAVRGGFAYYGSFLKNDDMVLDAPVAYKGYNISGGVGFMLSPMVSMDIAYVYMKSYVTNYDLYFYNGPDNSGANVIETTAYDIKQDAFRHNLIVSLNMRF